MLEFILVLLLVYFGLKIFFRFFGPAIMRWIMKKVGQKVEKKFREQYGFSEEKKQEGKTSIHKKSHRRKKPVRPMPTGRQAAGGPGKQTGEYIDYEEIE